jgi:hypothetical protein
MNPSPFLKLFHPNFTKQLPCPISYRTRGGIVELARVFVLGIKVEILAQKKSSENYVCDS